MVQRLRAAVLIGACLLVASCAPPPQEVAPGEAVDGVIEVVGNDRLQFLPNQITAGTGALEVRMTCEGAAPHTLVIDETDELVVECTGGNTGSGTVELDPGSYVFFCSIPGHRSQGMEGTLTVAS